MPAGCWGRTWLLAAALSLAGVATLELGWRRLGHRPTVNDDAALWALHRERAANGDRGMVALLGSSRIRLGFSLEAFHAAFPGRPIEQLAVDGKAPFAALADLAADPGFRGTVLCSVTALGLRAEARDAQADVVAYYHDRWSLDRRLNRMLATAVESRLALVSPDLSLVQVLRSLAGRGELPRPNYLRTYPDRSRAADYTRLDLEAHRAERLRRLRARYAALEPETPEQWLREALAVEPLVASIRRRGGRVIFLRYPTTGEHFALEERCFPRARYWDRFAARTSAATLHFLDVPALRGFDCPDTSHLDRRDVPRFTRALLAALRARGLLEPRRVQVVEGGAR